MQDTAQSPVRLFLLLSDPSTHGRSHSLRNAGSGSALQPAADKGMPLVLAAKQRPSRRTEWGLAAVTTYRNSGMHALCLNEVKRVSNADV